MRGIVSTMPLLLTSQPKGTLRPFLAFAANYGHPLIFHNCHDCVFQATYPSTDICSLVEVPPTILPDPPVLAATPRVSGASILGFIRRPFQAVPRGDEGQDYDGCGGDGHRLQWKEGIRQ